MSHDFVDRNRGWLSNVVETLSILYSYWGGYSYHASESNDDYPPQYCTGWFVSYLGMTSVFSLGGVEQFLYSNG